MAGTFASGGIVSASPRAQLFQSTKEKTMDSLSKFLDWLSTLSFGETVVLALAVIGVILTILFIIDDYLRMKRNGGNGGNGENGRNGR